MSPKSEKLKKLENELEDLEQWLALNLVPKKDIEKHKAEIHSLKNRILEEEERLKNLKENGELEEYAPTKKPSRPSFQDNPTISDIGEEAEEEEGPTDTELELETDAFESEYTSGEEEFSEEKTSIEEDEDPFSDRNRWRRGVLEDPESPEW